MQFQVILLQYNEKEKFYLNQGFHKIKGFEILYQNFEQKIDKKRLEVEFNCDDDNMIVTGDHDAIYQIFYNITDNAVKFVREEGLLKISITRSCSSAVILLSDGKHSPRSKISAPTSTQPPAI